MVMSVAQIPFRQDAPPPVMAIPARMTGGPPAVVMSPTVVVSPAVMPPAVVVTPAVPAVMSPAVTYKLDPRFV